MLSWRQYYSGSNNFVFQHLVELDKTGQNQWFLVVFGNEMQSIAYLWVHRGQVPCVPHLGGTQKYVSCINKQRGNFESWCLQQQQQQQMIGCLPLKMFTNLNIILFKGFSRFNEFRVPLLVWVHHVSGDCHDPFTSCLYHLLLWLGNILLGRLWVASPWIYTHQHGFVNFSKMLSQHSIPLCRDRFRARIMQQCPRHIC